MGECHITRRVNKDPKYLEASFAAKSVDYGRLNAPEGLFSLMLPELVSMDKVSMYSAGVGG